MSWYVHINLPLPRICDFFLFGGNIIVQCIESTKEPVNKNQATNAGNMRQTRHPCYLWREANLLFSFEAAWSCWSAISIRRASTLQIQDSYYFLSLIVKLCFLRRECLAPCLQRCNQHLITRLKWCDLRTHTNKLRPLRFSSQCEQPLPLNFGMRGMIHCRTDKVSQFITIAHALEPSKIASGPCNESPAAAWCGPCSAQPQARSAHCVFMGKKLKM